MPRLPMMRVVQISATDAKGGAALAANRLHRALRTQGVASTMFVAETIWEDENVRQFKIASRPSLNHFLYRVARRLQRRVSFPDGMLFTLDWTLLGGLPLRQLPPADVLHLHWIADFIDFRSLPRLASRAPLVWTFHDMNAFTGGCHYDGGCGRFTDQCGACPLMKSEDVRDVTSRVIRRKMLALQSIPDSRLVVVAPSEWMAGEVRRSRIFGRFETRVIPNGIDLDVYRPVDRAAVRQRLGFAPEDRVVLFVAETLRDGRKGWAALMQTLAPLLIQPRLRVLTIGNGDTSTMSGPQYRHLGRLVDPVAIRDAYNAADFFVIPSFQDNFPNTVIEALACGTPVAGFATGGIIDAVEEGECGLLAPTGDIAGFTECIRALLDDDALRRSMSVAARARAVAHYGTARQAQAHRALYEELIEAGRGTPARVGIPASLPLPS